MTHQHIEFAAPLHTTKSCKPSKEASNQVVLFASYSNSKLHHAADLYTHLLY